MTIIVIYKAKDGWRWQMKRSGRIVADSGEAYQRYAKCYRAVDNTIISIMTGNYKIQEPINRK